MVRRAEGAQRSLPGRRNAVRCEVEDAVEFDESDDVDLDRRVAAQSCGRLSE